MSATYSRFAATKIVIMFTDGVNTKGPDPKIEAQRLKNEGVFIIVVAIGNRVSLPDLRMIASRRDFVFNPSDFNQLRALLVRLMRIIGRSTYIRFTFYLLNSVSISRTVKKTYWLQNLHIFHIL